MILSNHKLNEIYLLSIDYIKNMKKDQKSGTKFKNQNLHIDVINDNINNKYIYYITRWDNLDLVVINDIDDRYLEILSRSNKIEKLKERIKLSH